MWYGTVPGHVGRAGALDTDHLRPLAKARQGPSIGHGRRPWRCEHAFILDPELKLESLTRVRKVARESRIRCVEMKGFPFAPGFSLNRCIVIQQPVTFDNMQRLSVRGSILVNAGKRPGFRPEGGWN